MVDVRTKIVTETTPPEETPAPAVESLAASLMEVSDMEDGTHSLAWEDFVSPVDDVDDETMIKLIVGEDEDDAPPSLITRTLNGTNGSKSDDEDTVADKIDDNVPSSPL